MSDIEQGVHWHLTQDAGVAALVSGRVHPVVLPQAVSYPCVSYQRVSTYRYPVFDGPSGAAAARIQVDCWAATYAGSKALAESVRTALDCFHGDMSPKTAGVCELLTEADVYDEEARVYRVIQDYRILFYE